MALDTGETMMSEILNALITLLAVVLTALAFKGAWLIHLVQDKEAEFKARKKEAKKYDK